MSKNIVLCSDGTGNTAILGRGTNVFKLYEAVDLQWREKDPGKINSQVAFYGDGVGTESLKWWRLITGAFGIGVRKNVKELYKQLASIYDPGDQIYLFGFSRGGYTVRLLAGLIAECGIIKTQKMSHRTLEQGADAAFDALRSRFYKIYLRKRDQCGTKPVEHTPDEVTHFRVKYPSWLPDGDRPGWYHAESSGFEGLEETLPTDIPPAKGVRIRFIGVWDTVVAYGFPLDEVAEFWDRFIYPFRFPDTCLSEIVDRACQALSIDDERATFAPVLWQGRTRSGDIDTRLEQVWFAGVHANVGGGYPKQGMSLVPLSWMMRKAEEAGLRFIAQERQFVDEHQNVHDKLYDSRAGLAAYYRYLPRDIQAHCTAAQIDRPKIHFSVLRRIQSRTDEYAPIFLPSRYDVDRTGMMDVVPDETDARRRLEQLEIVKDIVWWRRVLYHVQVILSVIVVLFAWWKQMPEPATDTSDWNLVSAGVYVTIRPLAVAADWVTPDMIQPGINGLGYYPVTTTLLLFGLLLAWSQGIALQIQCRELAYGAWRGSLPSFHNSTFPMTIESTPLSRLANRIRNARVSHGLMKLTRYALPPVVLVGLAVGSLVGLFRWVFAG